MASTRRFGGADGDARPPSTRPGVDRSARLSRAAIVGTAVAYVDQHGLADLTMRHVARALGVEAMSLYRYVAGRESLLDGMVESVVDELYADPEV